MRFNDQVTKIETSTFKGNNSRGKFNFYHFINENTINTYYHINFYDLIIKSKV